MIEDLHKQRAAQSDTTLGVVSSGPGEAHPPGQSGEPPAEMSRTIVRNVEAGDPESRGSSTAAVEHRVTNPEVAGSGPAEVAGASPAPGSRGPRPPASTPPPIRDVYGHRVQTIDGQDWCIPCGGSPSLWEECRPGAPRCDFCETAPADFSENGRLACSTGRCLADARRVA